MCPSDERGIEEVRRKEAWKGLKEIMMMTPIFLCPFQLCVAADVLRPSTSVHVCVCVRGMIRFIIICECSDRLMSYKVIQEHAAPVECCLQNKHINLTSSKSVLIDDTLS